MNRFKDLILAMPENEQAFTSQKQTWEKYLNNESSSSRLLNDFFFNKDSIQLSRQDLFNFADEADLNQFVIATILWGYPAGLRGNNFGNISNNLEIIVSLLEKAKNGISDWNSHYKQVQEIKGLGLSTYTKFLYFLKVSVNSVPALIFDDRIIKTINNNVFLDFSSLNNIRSHNVHTHYPSYLTEMDKIATKLKVKHGKLEMFIFEFGLNLKFIN